MPNDNIWQYWLEETPRAAYQALIPSGTPAFTKYWQGQQSNVWNKYMGALGEQALAGQPPNLFFTDFLKNYPWSRYWYNLSPSQRGIDYSKFMPSLTWRV